MHQAITRFLTQEDTQALKQVLLHSSCWTQGEHSCYGAPHLTTLWAHWLNNIGRIEQVEPATVDGSHQEHFVLCQLNNGDEQAPVGFWLKHDQRHIKHLHSYTDTQALVSLTQGNLEQLKAWWPQPDPLQLSDFDQQCHPHTVHAKPGDFISQQSQTLNLLNQWWGLWQGFDIAAAEPLYHPQCQWHFPGRKTDDVSQLTAVVKTLQTRLGRSYAQLEQILVDPSGSKAAVRWRLDGDRMDEQGQSLRVRLPLTSYLELSQEGIKREVCLFDEAAFQKRFGIASPLV